jgi:hypothetical protein
MFGRKMRQLLYLDSGESRESRPGPLASAVRSTLNFLTNPFRAAAQSPAAHQQQRRNQVNHICMEIPKRIILPRCRCYILPSTVYTFPKTPPPYSGKNFAKVKSANFNKTGVQCTVHVTPPREGRSGQGGKMRDRRWYLSLLDLQLFGFASVTEV